MPELTRLKTVAGIRRARRQIDLLFFGPSEYDFLSVHDRDGAGRVEASLRRPLYIS